MVLPLVGGVPLTGANAFFVVTAFALGHTDGQVRASPSIDAFEANSGERGNPGNVCREGRSQAVAVPALLRFIGPRSWHFTFLPAVS